MGSFKGKDIICFAPNDWWFHNVYANKQIMQCFACENRVLYINSTGIRTPSFHDSHICRRIMNKIKSFMRFFSNPEKNIYVFTPIAFPLMKNKEDLILKINFILLVFQLTIIMKLYNFNKSLLWVSSPVFKNIAFFLKKKYGLPLLFYCVDNLSLFSGVNSGYMRTLERELHGTADLAFYVNSQLAEERKCWGGNVRVVTHGVDYNHFSQAQELRIQLPADIVYVKKPIVGYVGEIKPLDFQLIKFLAQKHPDKSFLFIGSIYEDLSKFNFPQNVYFLGQKKYKELPNYMQLFDCFCLFYDLKDPFNYYRNPKKLLEYFATGKPVVSVDTPPLRNFGELIYIAENYDQFSDYINEALKEKMLSKSNARIAVAKKHTWEYVADTIGAMIVGKLNE